MKRKLIASSAIIFGFFFLTGIGIGQSQDFIKGFSLKLTGGYGTMAVGDFNTVVEDLDSRYNYIASYYGVTKEGTLKQLNYGIELEGEIIMKLPGNFGLGIGTGYYLRSKDSEFSIEEYLPGYGYFQGRTISLKPKFTAIPITLTFYYFLPSKSLVNLYLNGGIGYYFGKVTFTIREDLVPYFDDSPEWNEKQLEAKDQGFGLHGGVGLEFNVISKVAFFIEGNGIYCILKSWKGDVITEYSHKSSDKESGTVLYYEEAGYANFTTSKDRPNVRKLRWNLSGLSLRGGIRIRF
jgi:opacity protein-like surface antigen